MKNIKQQFIDFRNTTPKYLQWLLLGAAFVVVIILLTLVLGKKSKNNDTVAEANQQITFDIDPSKMEFKDIMVGKSDSTTLNVNVNTPVIIKEIKIADIKGVEISDFSTTNDCGELTDSCIIKVTYKPTAVTSETSASLNISWKIDNQEDVTQTESVPVSYSSKEEPKPEPVSEPVKEPEPAPEPVKEPEPVPEPVKEPEPAPEPDPEPIKEKIEDAISTIAPTNIFEPEPEFMLPPEKCSEFAIAGYDVSGKQIGWIKPERGANYFYPFEDKECSNPTGKYDMATGIITSIADGSKMGTDAEHIGYRGVKSRNVKVPTLSSPKTSATVAKDGTFENAVWDADATGATGFQRFSSQDTGGEHYEKWQTSVEPETLIGSGESESVFASRPYDRTFILRQFKPIPATIVSEVRADPSVYGCKNTTSGPCEDGKNHSIPVRATVDRNVFSDDGRTIIVPTGTLLMGYLEGDLPGPYQTYGRMNIKWYQFIRPDGVEFNFPQNGSQDPYSGDAQGRVGVPGHGSTDYVEQMVMPILTAMVPAAVNMIAPIADTVINQIDLDNNTIVQSGTMRSSEMAKQELISTWNKVAQKLLVDALDNTTPPFSIAAGTRINVFSPVDLIVSCDNKSGDKRKCAFHQYDNTPRRNWADLKGKVSVDKNDSSWIGQVRSFDLSKYCTQDSNGKWTINENEWRSGNSGQDYRSVLAFCQSQNYEAINNKKNKVYSEQVQQQYTEKYGDETSRTDEQTKAYNTDILGLQYDDSGFILDPFAKIEKETPGVEETITCDDGSAPDANGCCTGETYTDMGAEGFNCCPDAGGDCFPPIQ